MIATAENPELADPAVTRFDRISGLDTQTRLLVTQAAEDASTVGAHRELLCEGKPIERILLVLDGWAARVRYLQDGRRQIISFVLPGDLLGLCDHDRPVMSSTIVTIMPVKICTAPNRGQSAMLDHAYAVSRAIDEAHLLAQITRLGRLSAYERIVDLLLELAERLTIAGLAGRGRFQMPLTQEMLADSLGLTAVHVNRMLQQARRNGDLTWTGRDVVLHDVERLQRMVGRSPVRVSALR